MSHQLNLCPKGQTVFQAAASIWFGVPRRRNPSCKPIWLSSHDLSLQVWILSMICGFKSPALQDNWDWLSCVSVENNRRLKAGWIKKKRGEVLLRCQNCCWYVIMSSNSFYSLIRVTVSYFALCKRAIKVTLGCVSASQHGESTAVFMWNFLLIFFCVNCNKPESLMWQIMVFPLFSGRWSLVCTYAATDVLKLSSRANGCMIPVMYIVTRIMQMAGGLTQSTVGVPLWGWQDR